MSNIEIDEQSGRNPPDPTAQSARSATDRSIGILDRYIARHVVMSTLLALCVLVALFSFIAFFDDKDSIGDGSYTFSSAIAYMVLMTPSRAFTLFPVAALIGALLALGGLAANRELTVMRASGVSTLRLTLAAMGGAGVLVSIAVLVGEGLAPPAASYAEASRREALDAELDANTKSGLWVRDGRSFINIRHLKPGDRMEDVYVYEFDANRKLRVATHAKRGWQRDGEWHLEDLVQSRFDGDRLTREALPEAVWSRAGLKPEIVSAVSANPQTLSILGLSRYIGYLEHNGLNSARFELALWQRLTYPIACAVMIFLALPMVLGRLQTMGVGQRILLGTLVGVAFHLLNQLSSQLGLVYGLNPMLSAVLPTIGFALIGFWQMRQLH